MNDKNNSYQKKKCQFNICYSYFKLMYDNLNIT